MPDMIRVMTKAHNRRGVVYPSMPTEYEISLKDGYLTVYKNEKDGTVKSNAFQVGDEAEYDSYNLSYTGTITKITEKTVTIVAYPGSNMAKAHRLDMNEFCWRNYDFDAVETARKNSEEKMYLWWYKTETPSFPFYI